MIHQSFRGLSNDLLVLLVCGLTGVAAAQNDVTFSLLTGFSPSFGPTDMIVADVVGSANEDLVLLNPGTALPGSSGSVRVLEFAGPGVLPISSDWTVGPTPQRIYHADLDLDGDIDLVTHNAGNGTHTLLIRHPAGYTRTDISVTTASTGNKTTIADFNGDSLPDLAAGNHIRFASAPGVFPVMTQIIPAPSNQRFIHGDFDGDGDLDIVASELAATAAPRLRFFPNDGAGNFGSPLDTFLGFPSTTGVLTTYTPIEALEADDLNGDGIDDLVVATSFPLLPFSSAFLAVYVFTGTPAGTFDSRPPVTNCLHIGPTNIHLVLADVTGDGRKDLFVRAQNAPFGGLGNSWLDVLEFARNTGDGMFIGLRTISNAVASFNIQAPPGRRGLAIGDVDGDGALELVSRTSASLPASNIDIFDINTFPSPIPARVITPVSPATISLLSNTTNPGLVSVEVSENGVPSPNVPVVFDVVAGHQVSAITPCQTRWTDAMGRVSAGLNFLSLDGTAVVRASLENGSSTFFAINLTTYEMQVLSPSYIQVVMGGNPPTPVSPVPPVEVLIRDATTMQPIVGHLVTFSHTQFFGAFPNGLQVPTDSSGVARVNLTPQFVHGLSTYNVNPGFGTPAFLDLDVVGPTLTSLATNIQGTDLGENFHYPFEVRSVNYLGQPEAGIQVTFTSNFPARVQVVGPDVVLTDAQGIARGYYVSSGERGLASIQARREFLLTTASTVLCARGLVITGGASTGIVSFNYQHEDGPQPLLLAIDTPQPAGISTPYGTIHTSILAPGPALYLADALGQIGNFDPGLIANPNFVRAYAVPPSAAGFVFVAQFYGFDPTYFPDLNAALFVSNAVTKTL